MYLAYFYNTKNGEIFRSSSPQDNPKGIGWIQISESEYLSRYLSSQLAERDAVIAEMREALEGDLLPNLESGFIAQHSHRADVMRDKLLNKVLSILAKYPQKEVTK